MATASIASRPDLWERLKLTQMARTWELLLLLTAREVKLRYQGTVLGLLWTLAKPLLLGLVFSFALSYVLRVKVTDAPYVLFLLSALFPWTWFQSSIQTSAGSFSNNAALLKKVYFPRFVLPLSAVTSQLFHFVLSIPILVLLLVAKGYHPGPEWLLGVPLLIAIQLLLLAGPVLLVASLNVFLRDLEHLVEVLMTLWLYLTPILYPLALVEKRLGPVVHLNPMASLIEAWRDLFLYDQLPGTDIWPALVFAAVALVAGSIAFKALEGQFEVAL
ncbi:MAG: ABC transporter permease [Chloroflexota bacterium]|nr:ABC transporter permease [Chloroflexota bacterium]